DLALYDNESWNDPRDFAKPVKAISLPQDVPSTSDRRLIELENQVQRLMETRIAPMQPIQVNKIILYVRSAVAPTTLSTTWKIPSKLLLNMHPRVLKKREICLGVDLEPDEWIKDSGCSKHMMGNRKLLSTYKAYNGGKIIFGSNIRGKIIGKEGKVIGRGIRKKGLYVMKLGNKPEDKICLATIDENSTLWHRRLGHANMRLIQLLASKELVRSLPKLKVD
nr:hypothetical protein [Tanacetum cinerariifolium]